MDLPKVNFSATPFKGGNGNTRTFYDLDYSALLASSSNYRLKSGRWSGGGPFYVHRKSSFSTAVPINWVTGQNVKVYVGNVVAPQALSAKPAQPKSATYESYSNTMQVNYTEGFKRARPGNAIANAGQFLIELRDLPTLPLKLLFKLKNFRALGHEYLNVQFGWLPFVSDVRKMYNLYKTLDKRLAHLVRNNGKNRRIERVLNEDTSTDQSSSVYSYPFAQCSAAPGNYGNGKTQYTVTTKTTTRAWFVGNFRYFTPDIGSSEWTTRATKALFGLNPTPELLWEVLPWSWLVDWFSNIGDVISNASSNAVDNLVTNYSYTMLHTTKEVTYQAYSNWTTFGVSDKGGSASLYTRSFEETKLRYGGLNPFGVGVKLGSLSGYQLSILAALGLSRGLLD